MEDREALVASLRRALLGRTDVRVAYLFGSRARGDAREDSDADVARAAEVLWHLAKTLTHCGPSGAGQTVKLLNQIIVDTCSSDHRR